MTLDEVVTRIKPADSEASRRAAHRQMQLTKPPGSLGQLEELSIQLAGILGTERPSIRRETIIVAAGDHGVTAQGVTDYPQEVTSQMVLNFLSGGAAINVIARSTGVDLVIVDAGVASPIPPHPDLRVAAIGRSTGDISQGPAMSRDDAEASVMAGVDLSLEAVDGGSDAIGTGDMGIGNTTPSSAITSVITGRPPHETTGRGTGRTDAQLERKIAIVQRALDVNQPNPADGLDVLAKVGGYEIGTSFKIGRNRWQLVIGFIIAAAAGGLLMGFAGLVLLAVALVVSLALGWWVSRLIGGMTGDTYGAVNEVVEVSVLLLATALFTVMGSLFRAPLW